MADLTSVGISSGVPNSGTGTAATINYLTQVGTPISNGSTSAPVLVNIMGASSAPTSSMSALLVAISPNGVNPNGQALMAASAPVTIASNQTAITVQISSGTVTFSSNPTVILSSNPTVILSSNITIGSGNVSLVPTASGGLSLSSIIIASGTNSTLVASSPRQLYKVECFNNSATIGYLHLYNLSSAPTAGSSLVFDRILVPGNTSGAGVITTTDMGVPFGTGIGYTFTGGIADSDTTAISSNASYIVNIYYK